MHDETGATRGSGLEVTSVTDPNRTGWGVEDLPFPEGLGYIQPRWDLCIGCGACEMACSMFHYGVINRELSRIRIYRYLTPLPKSVQNVCAQCSEPERECQKACPLDPPAIYYDEQRQHMSVNTEECLGSGCQMCRDACPAKVPHYYPPDQDYAIVCDLCEVDGERRPQCVEICPSFALEYQKPQFPQHLERIHPDEKAERLSRRLYPLQQHKVVKSPEEIWGGR